MQSRPLAVVTGAARGIGASIAEQLASSGYDIAIADIDVTGADETLSNVAKHGKGRLFPFDLRAVNLHRSVIDQIFEWAGPISCLVNNAGIPAMQRSDLLDVSAASYDCVLDVNLRGTFFFTQQIARHMLATTSAHARSIVTVSSVSAAMASVERGEYCLSKAGLGMLTKLFALRLADAGIGVFEVRPGVIRTAMTEGVSANYDVRIRDGLVPMRRWGAPKDVARAVVALVDGELAFSSGSVINVDGALSIPRL